jgi:hypothetical protein
MVFAALKEAGVERGAGRIVEPTPGRRSSADANLDLADLGNFSFLSKIAFWRPTSRELELLSHFMRAPLLHRRRSVAAMLNLHG